MKILFQAITGIQKGLNMVSAVIVGLTYFILNIGSTFAPIYFNQSSEGVRRWADSTYYSVDCFRFFITYFIIASVLLGIILVIIQYYKKEKIQIKETIVSIVIFLLVQIAFVFFNTYISF